MLSIMENNYYKVLNLNQSASDQHIRQAYKKLALKFHPDKNKNVGTEEKFKLILEAHNVLIDPVEKAKFDKKLKDCRNQCSKCNAIFSNSNDLTKHYEKYHPKQFKCNYCATIAYFETSVELIKHVSFYHQFNCVLCSTSFGNIQDLSQHKLSFHSPATKTHQFGGSTTTNQQASAFSNFRFRKTETTPTNTGSSTPAPAKTGGFSFSGCASTGNDVFKFGGSSSNTNTASKPGPESAFTFGCASKPKPTFGGAKLGAKPSFFSFGGGATASAASKTKPAQQPQSSNFKCELCYWLSFSNVSELKQHNEYIHPKPFKCDKCSFSFFVKLDDLNLHIERFHPKKFQSFFSFGGGATASAALTTSVILFICFWRKC